LNGTTPVQTVNSYAFIASITINGAIPTYTGQLTITAVTGGGGICIFLVAPSIARGFAAVLNNAFSDPVVQKIRYQKLFWRNANTDTLSTGVVRLAADPSALIKQGVGLVIHTGTEDNLSSVNRFIAPAGITFVDDAVDQNLPGSQVLGAGHGISVWIEQTLAIAAAALTSTFTTRLTGSGP